MTAVPSKRPASPISTQAPSPKRLRPNTPTALLPQLQPLLEFWLSPANLTKDRFLLSELLKNDGWISPTIFLSFKKVSALKATAADILSALKHSHSPPLDFRETRSETQVRIRGGVEQVKQQVQDARKDEDERTLYIEPIPADTTREELEGLFSPFGDILYLSVPRFRKGSCKGFCFVEFGTVVSATHALESVRDGSVDTERFNALRALKRAEWRRRKEDHKEKMRKKRVEVSRERHAKPSSIPSEVPNNASNICTENPKPLPSDPSPTPPKATPSPTPVMRPPIPDFERGLILSVSGLMRGKKAPSRRLLFEALKEYGDIAFVDFTPQNLDICKARFRSPVAAAAAQTALSPTGGGNINGAAVTAEVLSGDVEVAYWQEVMARRDALEKRKEKKMKPVGPKEKVKMRTQPARIAKT